MDNFLSPPSPALESDTVGDAWRRWVPPWTKGRCLREVNEGCSKVLLLDVFSLSQISFFTTHDFQIFLGRCCGNQIIFNVLIDFFNSQSHIIQVPTKTPCKKHPCLKLSCFLAWQYQTRVWWSQGGHWAFPNWAPLCTPWPGKSFTSKWLGIEIFTQPLQVMTRAGTSHQITSSSLKEASAVSWR